MDTADDNKLELLRRACVAHGVGIENRGCAELRAALGQKLVDIMLNVPFPGASNSSTSSSSSSGSTDASTRKKQTMWHAFLRTEKVKVREGMPELKGHEILKEVARRWKLHKLVNTNSSPLMLTHNDDDDDEDETLGMLQQLTSEELRHNLVAAGIDIHNDPAVNARRLLRHIMDA